jgi:hypothetical protein
VTVEVRRYTVEVEVRTVWTGPVVDRDMHSWLQRRIEVGREVTPAVLVEVLNIADRRTPPNGKER